MLKNCLVCNSTFETKSSGKYCSKECKAKAQVKVKKCVVCNKEHTRKYAQTCSQECMIILIGNTTESRYGARNASNVAELNAKRNNAFKERYNGHPLQNKQIRQRIKETNLKKYNTEYATQNLEVLQKILDTFDKKYNGNPAKTKEIQDKMKATNRNKRRVDNVSQTHIKNFENYNREYVLKNFTANGKVSFNDRLRFKEYFGLSNIDNARVVLQKWGFEVELSFGYRSSKEKSLLLKLQNKYPKLTFIENCRKIIRNSENNAPLELDIVVKKGDSIICAIEYNGIYWHDKENPVKEALKTRLCAEKGIKLFHIWEDSEESGIKEVLEYLNKMDT